MRVRELGLKIDKTVLCVLCSDISVKGEESESRKEKNGRWESEKK